MILTLNDRLTILFSRILPDADNLAGIELKISIKTKVNFAPDEIQFSKNQNGELSYKSEKTIDSFSLDVDFTPDELEYIKRGAQKLDAGNAVTEDTAKTVRLFLK